MRIKNSKIILPFLLIVSCCFSLNTARASVPLDVIINEIAWMGTTANSSDEWIELYNNTNQDINLVGWELYEDGGKTLIEPLTKIIKAKSYYLVERTDDTTINDIPADQEPSGWGGYGLKNDGEHLQLLDNNSQVIDEVNCQNGWFAGDGKPDYKTMERKDPQISGSISDNWETNNGVIINGHDAEKNSINGTPKKKNSVSISDIQPELKPEPEPEPEPEPQPEPEPEPEPEIKPIIYPSGILINEITPSPKGEDKLEEWLELKNTNKQEVDISGWKIQDTIGSTKTYTFPEGTKIKATGYLILNRPVSKITLNNSGDELQLIQPNGNILDNVSYNKAILNQSYNRTESGWVWSATLTPGSTNIIPSPVSKTEASKSDKDKTEKPVLLKESQKIQTQKGLAAISEQIPESSESLHTFLIALCIAIFSVIVILVLKKRLKIEKLS